MAPQWQGDGKVVARAGRGVFFAQKFPPYQILKNRERQGEDGQGGCSKWQRHLKGRVRRGVFFAQKFPPYQILKNRGFNHRVAYVG
jgi:hypothetical protein